ncbi:hypothetical protein THAOC_36065 [Thalassiosira oceanica]|uniref:Protein kinase domain-containing protein n=1 Tax=Thalassiosira oceanica TaxID=159749 RepID=K0RFH7_THAOC|nr:hypothetical protein THAOC_36065 [Thalassiosira oceanica]|eukprot:EJK45322.1 hypothetical protein THAOC_36065 [Thalassiosira oceanica]
MYILVCGESFGAGRAGEGGRRLRAPPPGAGLALAGSSKISPAGCALESRIASWDGAGKPNSDGGGDAPDAYRANPSNKIKGQLSIRLHQQNRRDAKPNATEEKEEDQPLASGEEVSEKTEGEGASGQEERGPRRWRRRERPETSQASGGRQILRCSASSKKTNKAKLSPAKRKDRKRLRERACQAKKREDPDVRDKENAQKRARSGQRLGPAPRGRDVGQGGCPRAQQILPCQENWERGVWHRLKAVDKKNGKMFALKKCFNCFHNSVDAPQRTYRECKYLLELKTYLTDFGLSRTIPKDNLPGNDIILADYISTRWYRPPEVLTWQGAALSTNTWKPSTTPRKSAFTRTGRYDSEKLTPEAYCQALYSEFTASSIGTKQNMTGYSKAVFMTQWTSRRDVVTGVSCSSLVTRMNRLT